MFRSLVVEANSPPFSHHKLQTKTKNHTQQQPTRDHYNEKLAAGGDVGPLPAEYRAYEAARGGGGGKPLDVGSYVLKCACDSLALCIFILLLFAAAAESDTRYFYPLSSSSPPKNAHLIQKKPTPTPTPPKTQRYREYPSHKPPSAGKRKAEDANGAGASNGVADTPKPSKKQKKN
jgi:hypothetical protein